MKKISKALSLALAMIMLFTSTICYGAATKSPFISNTYTHQSRFDGYKIANGIDISYYNGDIDFAKVKKAGVEFAIIRAGYRGYGSGGTLCNDVKYSTYIKDAKAAGIKVGVYFYSQAIDQNEAVEEANFVLNRLAGQNLDLPVVWDIEFAGGNGTTGRLYNAKLTKSQMTNNALAFCNTIKKAGYDAMVYANASFLTNHLYPEKLEDAGYGIWLAHYTTDTYYTGNFNIWQYTSSGTVNGIDGRVDCNFMYIPPEEEFKIDKISNKVYTGSARTPKPTVRYKGVELVEGRDYALAYSNNVEIGKAKITITGMGDYADVKEKTEYFNIVPARIENLRLAGRGKNFLQIRWDKDPVADGYEIQVYRKSGWQVAGETANLYFTINDLTVASSYSVRVRAYKNVNGKRYDGLLSNEIKASTKPSRVNGLSYKASSNQITLSWNKVGNATGYNVYRYYPSTGKSKLYKSVTGNSVKITDLSANTGYSFTVEAYKDSNEGITLTGERSNVLKAYTSPKAPDIISAISPISKKIRVRWRKSSGISGYQIMWSTSSDFSSNYKTVNALSKNTSAVITTAQSGKKYYVRMRAYRIRDGKKIYSPWSGRLYTKVK